MSEVELVKNIPIVGADGTVLSEAKDKAVEENTGVMPFQDFDLYQMLAEQSNVTPPSNRLVEILTGLTEELGEFMSYHKRMMRGDYDTTDKQTEALDLAKKELGDMLWYMSAWCTIHKIPFGDVPYSNLEKLQKRMEKNMVKGSGDTREQDSKVVLDIVGDMEKSELKLVKEEEVNDAK